MNLYDIVNKKQKQSKPVTESIVGGFQVGDPVIITGDVNYNGKTGEIVQLGRDGAFVVVDLYNYGKHSFHSSDVSMNEYAGSDDEEARMYDAGEYNDADLDEQGVEEARKANTAAARAELSRRTRKEDPIQQDAKKKESDAAWERLMQFAADQKKSEQGVAEGTSKDAWAAGYQAFHDDVTKCPYTPGSEEASQWNLGWESAQARGWNKEGVAEGTQTVGHEILGMLRQVKRQGHDAMEELYSSCPLLAQYWDQYEGDFRSMVVELSPKTLNRIKVEISAFNQQDDNDEDYYSLPMPNGDRDELDEQGVAEGVQDTLSLQDAAKVLKQYGATNLKTTSNELHFYKNGRPFSVDLIWNGDIRNVSLSQLNAATRGLKGQGVAEGYSLGKVLSLPELLGQIKHILTAKHRGIGWRMTMPAENTFLFSARNDYDVWSMLVVEAGGDDWVSVGHGMVDPDGKPIIFDRQQLPITLASASEIADEAIQTYHDIDLSDYADDEDYNQGVAEGEEMGTFAALKDWQVWNVHVYNNFYRGKYADYGPRPYSVVASSPEEARQIVINNPDYVLQDLLSRKLQNGKKVLPRQSALAIEEKRVGKAEPGSITTMGLKKMLTPDGVQSFKFTNGKIVDGAHVQGGEEMAETRGMDSYEKDVWASQQGFDRPHDHRGLGQELAHERNNLQVTINGKPWKVFPGRGTADSREEYKYLQSMKEWAAKKSAQTGKKWAVYLTGAEPTLEESDISGLLAAANLNKAFIITAELAEGGTKRFKVKAQSERVAIEKFKKHASMANIINVKEVPFSEDVAEVKDPEGTGLSNELLDQYKQAAGISMRDLDKAGKYSKADTRYSMVNRATKKQSINDLKKHPKDEVTESYLNKMKKAGYDIK